MIKSGSLRRLIKHPFLLLLLFSGSANAQRTTNLMIPQIQRDPGFLVCYLEEAPIDPCYRYVKNRFYTDVDGSYWLPVLRSEL